VVELDGLGKVVEAVGRPIAGLLLAYLILKTPAVQKLLLRASNGQHKNGSPKVDMAGQASVDFWKNTFREIVKEILDEHERDEERRADEMRDELREHRAEYRAAVELLRGRLHDIANHVAVIALDSKRKTR